MHGKYEGKQELFYQGLFVWNTQSQLLTLVIRMFPPCIRRGSFTWEVRAPFFVPAVFQVPLAKNNPHAQVAYS